MIIRTVDTDVVVLAIGHFLALRLDELWVSFGVGTHFRQIAIHEIVKNVKEKALMLFHAISVCDTVSSYLGNGKKSAWLARHPCPSVTDASLNLSRLQPEDVSSEILEKIERFIVIRFIVIMYSRKCSASGVNEARKELFAQWRTSHQPKRHCCNMCKQGIICVVTSDPGWKSFWTEIPEASTVCLRTCARRAAGASANAVHRIYSAQNFANVAEHVATTCSS